MTEEVPMKRSLWQSLLGLLTLGITSPGCSKPETPPPPADVTAVVPAMN